MAINATTQWWLRSGGNNLNGGGYDSAISGATTNYADQDAAQLSLTDFATSGAGVATLTSVTGGFTSAMIGNCIRIASGTNFTAGYYFITARASTNSVTLDRSPTPGGAGSGGTGRVGGAFAHFEGVLVTDTTGVGLTVATPLAAGHQINVRGAGLDVPVATDYTATGYSNFPSGDSTNGTIRWVGYNGRPQILCNGLTFYGCTGHSMTNFKFKCSSASNGDLGIVSLSGGTASGATISNCHIDQAGFDVVGLKAEHVIDCYCYNSGSTSAGSYAAIYGVAYGGVKYGNYVKNWRGRGIQLSVIDQAHNNILDSCAGGGIYVVMGVAYHAAIIGNVIYNCGSHGIEFAGAYEQIQTLITNNIFSRNTGYGIVYGAGTTALNDRSVELAPDWNAFDNNTSGQIQNLTGGANNITLSGNPFTNSAGGDFSLNNTAGAGAACRALRLPTTFRGSATASYGDIGAAQHQDSGTGGGLVNRVVQTGNIGTY